MAGGATGVAGGSPVFGAKPGVGGAGGAKFLSTIYAAGLADAPLTDNLFGMPSGNFRFYGLTANGQLPGFAYYENVPGEGDSRFPIDYQQRYYPVAQGVGGFETRWVYGYDPLFNGNFTGSGGVSIIDTRVGFTADNTQDGSVPATNTLSFGFTRWSSVFGFFDGPRAYPTPGFNNGSREDWELFLYNSFTGGIFNLPSFSVNGWGQGTYNTISNAQGVITASLNLAFQPGPSPLALDGWGIFWTVNSGDPPKAVITPRLLTTNLNGAYQLAFYTNDGSGLDGPICTMDWTNGIVFNAPVTGLGNGTNVQLILSADIDVQTPGVYQWTPSIPGYYIAVNRTAFFVTQRTGVATSGFTCNWGNDGPHTNYGTSAAVSINAVNATTLPAMGPGPAFNTNNQPLINGTTPISVQITSGVTGTTVCKGQFALWCALIPIGQLV